MNGCKHRIQYLGDKVTGRRWISSLIMKLWDIAWDMWNYRNHTLHDSDGPTKAAVLTHANSRISYHFNRGTIGIATRCHFLFKTKENILLSLQIIKKLGCIAATPCAQRWAQRPNTRRNVYLSADQIFLIALPKTTSFPHSANLRNYPHSEQHRDLKEHTHFL